MENSDIRFKKMLSILFYLIVLFALVFNIVSTIKLNEWGSFIRGASSVGLANYLIKTEINYWNKRIKEIK